MIRRVWKKVTAVIVLMSFVPFEVGLSQPLAVNELLQGAMTEKKVEEPQSVLATVDEVFSAPDSLSFLESDSPLSEVADNDDNDSSSFSRKRESSFLRSSIEEFEDDTTPSAERPSLSLSPYKGVDDTTSSAERTSLSLSPYKGEDDMSPRTPRYESQPERMSFEDALEELRPEYASAVIVDSLTQENLRQLLEQPIEVAILVIYGEIVLLTSGSEDEIGVLPASRALIDRASFISHTHPGAHSSEGPSSQDVNEAVESSLEEYVITHHGIYAYNRDGLLNQGAASDFSSYLSELQKAVVATRSEKDQVQARQALNQFIAEQDRYNQANEQDRITFRRGGTLSYTSGLTSSGVTTLVGNPYPYLVANSTSATTLSVSSNQFAMGYSVPAVSDISGFSASFDNASTPSSEYQNLSALTYLTFGLKGPNSSVKLEIVDANNITDTFTLTNIVNTAERFWRIPVSAILNTLDKTRIKAINFIVGQPNTTSAPRSGVLYIRSSGLNTNAPTSPTLSAIPPAVNTANYTLSGTKEANAAILIGGVQVVASNSSTTWAATVPLTVEGNNTFSITTKSAIGKVSAAITAAVKKDTIIPTGSININSGSVYALSQIVTLNLNSSDGVNTTATMSFSTDNQAWTVPEAYVTSKNFTLPAGDGSKTVYVKYFDKAGNSSAVYSKAIILDTQAPVGTIAVNGGVAAIKQSLVTLNLSAVDAGSGLDKMIFSSDNVTWTAPEAYATTKAWSFSTGDGNKTVYVKFLDKSSKWSSPISATVMLDTKIPTGSFTINSGTGFTKTSVVTLNLSAADTGGSGVDKMSFSSDNVTWTAAETYAVTKSWTLTAGDGNKTVYVKYYDKAGNVSGVISRSIYLDTIIPSGFVSINSGASFTKNAAVTLNMSAVDAGSGVSTMSFSTDNISWTPVESFSSVKPWTFQAGDGLKTIYVKYYDKAGNVSGVMSKAITLDTINPTGSININAGAVFANSAMVTLNLSAADSGSGIDTVSFSTDNLTWTAVQIYGNSKSFTLPLGDGAKTVYAKYYDKAGNVSAVSSKSITLDTTLPEGSLKINGSAAMTDTRDVVLDTTASDAVSGVDRVRISSDAGVTWGSWENPIMKKNVTLPEGFGNKEVRYEIRDKAGNVRSLSSVIVFSHAVSPITFTSSTESGSRNYTLTYTYKGQSYSENWLLSEGENQLLVRTANNPAEFASMIVTYFPAALSVKQTYSNVLLGLGSPLSSTKNPSDLVTVSTQDGLLLRYDQDRIVLIEKPGEYIMDRLVWDAQGGLLGGELRYVNGDNIIVMNSKVVVSRSFDGIETFYDDAGRSLTTKTLDEKFIRFAYRLDMNGAVISSLSLDQTANSLYENGKAVWIVKKDASEIRYADGRLSEYRDSAGNRYRFALLEVKTGGVLTGYQIDLKDVVRPGYDPIPTGLISAQPSPFPALLSVIQNELALRIDYDLAGNMTRFISGKNEELLLASQLPISLRDASGQLKTFTSQSVIQGEWKDLAINQNGLTQTYGHEGRVVKIQLKDGASWFLDENKLKKIQLEDGATIDTVQWNGDTLTDFSKTNSDGSVETYVNGRVVNKKDPNGNSTDFFFDQESGHDKPAILTTADGRTYHYIDYKNSAGLTDRVAELLKVDLPDGGRVEFEHGKPIRFVQSKEVYLSAAQLPDLPKDQSYVPELNLGPVKLRAVTMDANGTILSGELFFLDGTQYFIEQGRLTKQVTTDGQIVEVRTENIPQLLLPPAEAYSPQELNAAEIDYRNDLMNKQLDYFISGVGIDPKTGFPMDNYDAVTGRQSTYSQATLVGMWAEILSAIALGHFVTPKISRDQALQKLDQMLLNLCEVQRQAGWNGMFSFFGVSEEVRPILDAQGKPTGMTETVPVYKRQFNDIGLGDNLNLSVSLNSVIGAIQLINDPALIAIRDRIVQYCYHIVWKQDAGYAQFFDAATGRFRMAYQFNADGTGQFTGYMDRVFNEFRPGLIWLASFKPAYRSAVEKLDVAIRTFETSEGNKIDNAVPFDGGAFQMFWPLLHVDETKYVEFDTVLKNFLYTQADYVEGKGIPGLISAGSDPGKGYNGKMGVSEAAETDDFLESRVGSLYGTASAFLVAPHYTLQFLKNLETAFPGIRTQAGLVDSIRIEDVSTIDPVTGQLIVNKQPVYAQQYYGVDQAGFLLSLLGTSQSYFDNYLTWQGEKQSFDELYRSMVFGLAPVADTNPAAPNFGMPVNLFSNNNDADGHSSPLMKQQAFMSSVNDPDFGQGRIFNYLTPSGQFHHTQIEFQDHQFGFQEYLLLPGRNAAARSLTAGLKYNLLDEGTARGSFYTPGYGFASDALMLDPQIGEVNRLGFSLSDAGHAVGLWTKYDKLDLTRYDYLSVPLKLADDAKPGTRLKFEFKGMGEVFITPPLTADWQYIEIPVVRPADLLTEIAVVVQSPHGPSSNGAVLIGPLMALKIRTSNELDWTVLVGKTEAEIRELLKKKVLEGIVEHGGKVLADESLEDFTLDSQGKLISGVLKRNDGSVQYFNNGRLSKWVFPDGRTVLFEKGLATFILDLSRGRLEQLHYYYDQDFRGNVKSFVVQDNDRKRIYGADGNILQMIEGNRVVNFKDGIMDNIVLPQGVLSEFVFDDAGNLVNAHVKTAAGEEFDTQQPENQIVTRTNGDKIYYSGKRISALETQNGRSEFTYKLDAAGRLMGVDVNFRDEITDPVTGAQSMVARVMSLFDYLQRPERAVEKSEILRESPVNMLKTSGLIAFSTPQIPQSELTYALSVPVPENNSFPLLLKIREGQLPGDAVGYLFQYQSTGGAILGASLNNGYPPVNIDDYDFLNITLRQNPDMDWNQDFNLKLKSPNYATLYNFQLQNTTTSPQTFSFPLDGKLGTEGQITLEVIRETDGVGKLARVYLQDISYVALKSLDAKSWENGLSLTASQIRNLYQESKILTSIGSEIAHGQPLVYSQLALLKDVPTWMSYVQRTSNEDTQLINFKRFDGSSVTLDGNSVSKIVLPDGTVNEYSAQAQTTGSLGGQMKVSGLNDCVTVADCTAGTAGNLNYNYGALRKVTQTDGHELSFAYEFDEEGHEVTVIHDSFTGDTRRFKEGELIESDSSDQRQTIYSYEQGRIAAAEIMYKKRVLDSTSYHYTQEETQVTDEQGTTWYYDVNGNLLKHLTKDGYLYRYTRVSHELENAQTFPLGDYKNAMLTTQDLQAVHLSGFEAQDGSQLIFDMDQENSGEVHLSSGAQGVNLIFDDNQNIKSGQIQFADGLIVEIENYSPRRGRTRAGSLFDLPLPLAEAYELLQGADGSYAGYRFKIAGKHYTYDSTGSLIKFETDDGRTDTLSYFVNGQGSSRYNIIKKQQIAFGGVPYPKTVEVKAELNSSNQKILRLMERGQEIVSKEGSGFVVGVYKAVTNQWDVQTGTFASASDRLALKNFLLGIKPGEYMTAVVSDAAFSSAGEDILSLFESMGAGGLRQAAAQTGTNAWSFFGMKGLAPGAGIQKIESGNVLISFSTLTETQKNDLVVGTTGAARLFEGQPLALAMPAAVGDAFSGFLRGYEKLKLPQDIQKTAVYNDAGDLVFSRRMDGVVSYYELGKIRETFASDGRLLYEHEYDCKDNLCKTGEDMKLSSIRLVKARSDFAAESARLRQQIEQAKFDALYKLSAQNDEARVRINEIVQDGLNAINDQISTLESQRYQDVKQCRGGLFGKKCKHYTVEVPGVQDAINNLSSQRSDLLATQESELAKIPGGVAAKKTEIENATREKLAEISTKEGEFYTDILRNEIEPILTDYYRRILGRDPSTAELNNWVAASKLTGKVPVAQLELELLASAEKQMRENQKTTIIHGVRVFLDDYLAASLAQKKVFLQTLKLDASEVIDLDHADADKILTYLESRSLHFGQSAFSSLRELLISKGITVSLENLGRETILIDVLTGVINPFTEGELLISLFSLSRTAAIHNAEFDAVKYDFNDLRALYSSPALSGEGSRLIAHIGEDHYVVITKVTDTDVFYRETSKGAEGEEVKASRDDFMKVWGKEEGRGYLLVDKAQLRAERKISVAQAQKIKGSFFFLFLFVASIVLTAASAVVSTFSPALGRILGIAAMVAGVVGVVASIGNLVISGLKMAFNFVSAVAQQGVINTIKAGFVGLTKILMMPVHFVGRFISGGFTFLKEGFQTGLAKLGVGLTKLKNFLVKPQGSIIFDIHHNEVQLFTGRQIAARQILSVAVGVGGSKVLGGFGFNSTIASLATAFVSGGFSSTGGALSGFLKTGLQHLIMQGVSEIGLKIGLPPPVSGVLSSLTGASLKAWFDPQLNLKQSIKEITPQITGQLALSGMELVGRSLGISPILSKLVGLPFASGLGGIVGGLSYGIKGKDLFTVIKQSVLSGISSGLVSIGANLALDAIGAPVDARALLEGFLRVSGIGESLRSKIKAGLAQFGRKFSKAGNAIVTFGQKVLEQTGQFTATAFKNTLAAFSDFFDRKTQEAIKDDISGIRAGTVTVGGSIWTWVLGDKRITYNSTTGELESAVGENGAVKIAGLGEDREGGLYYEKINSSSVGLDGARFTQQYEYGHLKSWQYVTGASLISVKAAQGKSLDQGDWLDQGSIEIGVVNVDIDYPDSEAPHEVIAAPSFQIDFEISDGKVTGAKINALSGEKTSEVGGDLVDKKLYVLANGIDNPNLVPIAPNYVHNLESDLISKSQGNITQADLLTIPLYFWQPLAGSVPADWARQGFDALLLALEAQSTGAQTYLTRLSKVMMSIHYFLNPSDRTRAIVGIGYSGGFIPMLEAIASGLYNVAGFIALGAATAGLSDEKVNQIINAAQNIVNSASDLLSDSLTTLFAASNPIIGAIMQAVTNNATDIALNYLKQGIQDLANTLAPKTPDITGTNAQFLVNLWGTNDILNQLGIGGYRTTLGGFTSTGQRDPETNETTKQLFNIEILGADHFDYMRDSSRPNQAWNLTLSDFVARLMIASQSNAGLAQFLSDELQKKVVLFPHTLDNPTDYYVVNLPGHP